MNLNGRKIIFDQHAETTLSDFLKSEYSLLHTQYYLIFGPEGGFTEDECRVKNVECRIKLTENRLRSAASLLCMDTKL